MPTYLPLTLSHRTALPEPFRADDVRYPESLVEHFLHTFTQAGEVVFDPFAGFGTTLLVAERLGRAGWGMEWESERVAYVRQQLHKPERLLHGDSRQLATYPLPTIDFSITSPPYMNQDDPEDPFTAYHEQGGGYAAYLQDLRRIYEQLRARMRPGGKVVIEVANLKREGRVTPLAWDVAREVSQVLSFDGEQVLCWDKYGYGYDHSYALIFTVP